MRHIPGVLLAILSVAVVPGTGSAQDVPPPQFRGAYEFLVPDICLGPDGAVLPGASPLDGAQACPARRKIGLGEPLPYRKRDWPGIEDAGGQPDGYQETASFPIRTTLGLAVMQTWDFGGDARAFGHFDRGDGGQVAFFSDRSVSFGLTEDGGAGLQLFIGPGCALLDSWIIVDRGFATAPSGETTTRLTRQRSRCPNQLDHAYTGWRVQPVAYRTRARGRLGAATLDTLLSEHYGGRDAASADHLERFYFTRELGATRWERWQNLAVQNTPEHRAMAERIAASGRCVEGVAAPGQRWAMVDCREWTQILQPVDLGGDATSFWLDRLRRDPSSRALFPE